MATADPGYNPPSLQGLTVTNASATEIAVVNSAATGLESFTNLTYNSSSGLMTVGPTTNAPGNTTLFVRAPGTSAGSYERIACFSKSSSEGPGLMLEAKAGTARISGDFRDSGGSGIALVLSAISSAGAVFDQLTMRAGGGMFVASTRTEASAAGTTWDGNDILGSTLTITGGTNITTATGVNCSTFRAPTLSAASALTVTNAATVYVAGPPAGGGAGPATITNAYSLWVDAGLSRFDGNGTHVFELPADATDPTGGGGAATGRIPVSIGGATRYLAYY